MPAGWPRPGVRASGPAAARSGRPHPGAGPDRPAAGSGRAPHRSDRSRPGVGPVRPAARGGPVGPVQTPGPERSTRASTPGKLKVWTGPAPGLARGLTPENVKVLSYPKKFAEKTLEKFSTTMKSMVPPTEIIDFHWFSEVIFSHSDYQNFLTFNQVHFLRYTRPPLSLFQ